jgi:uncharacterized caspase-like protein
VIVGLDLGKREMEGVIQEFTAKLVGVDVALFFYAGHSLQVVKQNFLMPIDARLAREAAVDFETIPLTLVLRHMQAEAKTNLVFLDACRDNPLAKTLGRTAATRSSYFGRGLAQVEAGGIGTLISFSTQPDNVASDGEGRNSPYTTALLKHIEVSGIDISMVMMRVRNEVFESTQRQQVPWEHSSLTQPFQFKLTVGAGPATPPPGSNPQSDEATAWSTLKDSNSVGMLEAFLKTYSKGIYADLARARLQELQQMRLASEEARAKEAKEKETRERSAREAEAREREAKQREVREKAAREVALAQPPLSSRTGTPDHTQTIRLIKAWIERDFLRDNVAYSPVVDWNDRGPTSREAILREQAEYAARWPERQFRLIPGTLQITTIGPNRYTAIFNLSYAVHSRARNAQASGNSHISIDVETIGGVLHVTRQRETKAARPHP